ncbi:MAG: GGDEF domain-containing protein, partial [Defluviicoccus sp.]|nr:GGDEF domain-containing protein [Defluviicoccus sp.]
VGDTVLRSVASLLAASVRPYDAVFRYGGEEFLLCLPNADLRTAWAIAERLRLKVAGWSIPIAKGAELRTSVSTGIAPLSSAQSVEATLERADAALYAAKSRGRNCVVVRNA